MELLEAIKSRRSIRAYKPDPVPKSVLTELLEVATCAPSGSNTQPWEFIVLTGETLGELNRAMIERLHSGKMKPEPDEDILVFSFPTGLYKERSAKFYPKDVRMVLNITESKRIVVGIAIGYPDWNHPLNSLRTDREPVEKLAA